MAGTWWGGGGGEVGLADLTEVAEEGGDVRVLWEKERAVRGSRMRCMCLCRKQEDVRPGRLLAGMCPDGLARGHTFGWVGRSGLLGAERRQEQGLS